MFDADVKVLQNADILPRRVSEGNMVETDFALENAVFEGDPEKEFGIYV